MYMNIMKFLGENLKRNGLLRKFAIVFIFFITIFGIVINKPDNKVDSSKLTDEISRTKRESKKTRETEENHINETIQNDTIQEKNDKNSAKVSDKVMEIPTQQTQILDTIKKKINTPATAIKESTTFPKEISNESEVEEVKHVHTWTKTYLEHKFESGTGEWRFPEDSITTYYTRFSDGYYFYDIDKPHEKAMFDYGIYHNESYSTGLVNVIPLGFVEKEVTYFKHSYYGDYHMLSELIMEDQMKKNIRYGYDISTKMEQVQTWEQVDKEYVEITPDIEPWTEVIEICICGETRKIT